MMRRTAALSLLFLGVGLVPPSAEAKPITYVTHDCQHVKVKPRAILFACGDGNFYVKRLHWRAWHLRRAVAHGVYHFNDCKPDCARGTFHKRRGRLVLRRRLWCPDIDKFVFRRAKVRYKRPWNGKRRFSFRLFCPF
jgi:hypothetical protein